MIRVAKRGELDAFKFKIDKSFLEQIIKYEEIITQLAELGSIISDEDKCYGLIKALPFSYREKLSNFMITAATATPNNRTLTFQQTKTALIALYERDVAWHILPTSSSPSQDGQDKALTAKDDSKGGKKGNFNKKNNKSKGDNKNNNNNKKQDGGKGNNSPPNCFNCGKSDHTIWKCEQPLSLEARQKHNKWKKDNNPVKNNKDNKEKKGEKEATCFAVGRAEYAFAALYTPPHATREISSLPTHSHFLSLPFDSVDVIPESVDSCHDDSSLTRGVARAGPCAFDSPHLITPPHQSLPFFNGYTQGNINNNIDTNNNIPVNLTTVTSSHLPPSLSPLIMST